MAEEPPGAQTVEEAPRDEDSSGFLEYAKQPRGAEIGSLADSLSERVWAVVGGSDRGGLLVREGASLKSGELPGRLATGALVRELALVGERLYYQLLGGDGPSCGWVSLKVKGADMLTKAEPDVAEGVKLLIRRLAMLPSAVRDMQTINASRCWYATGKVYGSKGCLAHVEDGAWRAHAALPQQAELASFFPAFPAGDSLLASLLADTSLKPVRRVFPRSGEDAEKPQFARAIDPVDGLLPDAFSVAYFIGESGVLRGAVRFGPQSTGTMSRSVPAEEGECSATAHGGATACVLYDAVMYLARLSWTALATPRRITCTLSKPCPLFHTLELSATLAPEGSSGAECSAKVFMKAGKILIAQADVLFVRGLGLQLSQNPALATALAAPCADWVPHELALARFPRWWSGVPTWDKESYMAAAFDEDCAARFPKACAPVEDRTKAMRMKRAGLRPHVRANRPVSGGDFRSDLSFVMGLAPAAMSFYKWYDDPKGEFTGAVKFGPQASDAWFLEEGGLAAADLSLAAHYGVVLAVLDEYAAHLPRCKLGISGLTWRLEMEVQHLVPLGQELDVRTWVAAEAAAAETGATIVRGEVCSSSRQLVSLVATIAKIE